MTRTAASRHHDLKQVGQIGVCECRFDRCRQRRTRKIDLGGDDLRWSKHAGREIDVELLVFCLPSESDCSCRTTIDRHVASFSIKRDLIRRQILVRKIAGDVRREVCDTCN